MGAMVAGTPKPIVAGAIIGGKYRIERELARGGQGTVMLATHLGLRQSVAIKFSNLEGPRQIERMKRLVAEARAAFRLRGEHVVRVIDVDVDDGMPFIVMEYLQGTTLKDLIASRGPLPVAEAVDLVLQACEGVAEAHDLGIAHRDLKPSNLFLADHPDAGSVLKVLDFGIAKTLTPLAPDGDLSLTAPLTFLGSPGYISPEQARDPRQVDTRTDIWSLGLVLHELLTGRPAFHGRTRADILALVLLKEPTPISLLRPDVPLEIQRVIHRCLQKLPEYRFSTVRALAAHLLPFVSPAADTGRLDFLGSRPVPAPERDPAPYVTRTFSASVPPTRLAKRARLRTVAGRAVRSGWSPPLRQWSRCPGCIGSGPRPCSHVRRPDQRRLERQGSSSHQGGQRPQPWWPRARMHRRVSTYTRMSPAPGPARSTSAPRSPLGGSRWAPTPAGAGALGSVAGNVAAARK